MIVLRVGPRPPLYYLHELRVLLKDSSEVVLRATEQHALTAHAVAKLMGHHSKFTETRSVSPTEGGGVDITVALTSPLTGQYRYPVEFFEEEDSDEVDERTDEVYEKLQERIIKEKGVGKRSFRLSKKRGLGKMSILSHRLVYKVLKFLQPHELSGAAAVSQMMMLYVEDESIWKKIVSKATKGNVWFCESWKRTYCNWARRPPQAIPMTDSSDSTSSSDASSPVRVENGEERKEGGEKPRRRKRKRRKRRRKWFFVGERLPTSTWEHYSPEEFEEIGRYFERKQREWMRTTINCADEMDRLWFPCQVPQIQKVDARSLSVQEFRERFEKPRIPCILTHAMQEWPALHKWTEENLVKHWGKTIFRAGKGFKMSIEKFVRYAHSQREARPQYLFDDDAFDENPLLHADYEAFIPPLFREDYFNLIKKGRPPNSWLVMGPARTGASFHCDPWQTSAWNALFQGHKRWTLFPPGVTPPGVDGNDDFYSDDYSSPKPLRWHLEDAPFIKDELRPIEIIQGPGEIIYIPSGWWHQVLNLDLTICCTQNYVNECNVEDVALEIALSPRKWTEQFKAALREAHPELFEDGVLNRRFAGIDCTGADITVGRINEDSSSSSD